MAADDLAQRFGRIVLRNIVDAPRNAVRPLNERVADDRREHHALRVFVQRHDHDAVGVAEVCVLLPCVLTQQQIEMLPVAGLPDLIRGEHVHLGRYIGRGKGQRAAANQHQQQTDDTFHSESSFMRKLRDNEKTPRQGQFFPQRPSSGMIIPQMRGKEKSRKRTVAYRSDNRGFIDPSTANQY